MPLLLSPQYYGQGLFPNIEGTAVDTNNTISKSHVFTLPTGIVDGELLLLWTGFNRSSNPGINVPAGWTAVHNQSNIDNTYMTLWYKTASSESGSVTITTNENARSVGLSYRISKANQTPVDSGLTPGQNSATPDPPAISGITKNDNLFICFYGCTEQPATGYPTDFDLGQITGESTEGGSDPALGMAARKLNADNVDPGTFTIASSTGWGAGTIVVYPA